MSVKQIGNANSIMNNQKLSWEKINKVPKGLVKDLKNEVAPKLQNAVFDNMGQVIEVASCHHTNNYSDLDKKFQEIGFEKLMGKKGLGNHYKLPAASGDYQYVNVIYRKNGIQISLDTMVGDTLSQIGFFEDRADYPRIEDTAINSLYVNDKPARPTQTKTIKYDVTAGM